MANETEQAPKIDEPKPEKPREWQPPGGYQRPRVLPGEYMKRLRRR